MNAKLLVTGSAGQLGSEFCRQLAGRFEVVGVTRQDADITDLAQITEVIKKHKPEYVIHTAAFTDVDVCEKESKTAMEVNATGAGIVALAAHRAGAEIVYFSTDYVFDGTKDSAYVEGDVRYPISEYGCSKRAGEMATIAFNKNWTTIRSGWIYSQYGKNFVKSILTSAIRHESPIRVVNDQFGSPTWTKDIVNQTAKIIESKQTGLFHVASKGEISRYGFAKMILERLMPDSKIEPCETKDFPRPAKRPARSSLKSERLDKLGIDIMRPYDKCLTEFLDQYGDKLLNEITN